MNTIPSMHPYRQLAIDLYYLEDFLFNLKCLSLRPAQVDKRQQLLDFLNEYVPDPDWGVFCEKYMDQPARSELVAYHFIRGLTKKAICRFMHTSMGKVNSYLEAYRKREYMQDPMADKLVKKFQPAKVLIEQFWSKGVTVV